MPDFVRLDKALEVVRAVHGKTMTHAEAICELGANAVTDTNAVSWESDHQQRILKEHGLDEEFPWGCDAIEHVAGALIAARDTKKILKAIIENSNISMIQIGNDEFGEWFCQIDKLPGKCITMCIIFMA